MKQKKGIERREKNPDLVHPRLLVHVNQNAIKNGTLCKPKATRLSEVARIGDSLPPSNVQS